MSNGNTKYGDGALNNNINGSDNSAFGICSSRDTNSSWNTSVGAYANMSNVGGISNVAVGTNSLLLNSQGSYNTAIGTATLLKNLSNSNTAIGSNTMENNETGDENIAIGVQSGYANTTGGKNTFIGTYAGISNINGNENVFLGFNSGLNTLNTSNTSQSGNTFLGANTKNTGQNYATVVGYGSEALISDGITLGRLNDSVLIPGKGYINNNDPANEIVTRQYVDTYVTTGINFTKPCACATTDNVNLGDYQDSFIDDVPIATLDASRVLVKCQYSSVPSGWQVNDSTLDASNGIYIFHYNAPPGNSYFTRDASDCEIGDNVSGQSLFVRNGTYNGKYLFRQDVSDAIVGTNSLQYIQVYQIEFELGDGLEYISNTLNVKPNLTDKYEQPFLTNVEFLGDVSVNGHFHVESGIDCCGNVVIADYTGEEAITELLVMAQKNTKNRLGFSLNPGNGSYNRLTQSGDNIMISGDVTGGNPLVIGCWTSNQLNCGIRFTPTNVVLGCGGSDPTPTNRITLNSSNISMSGRLDLSGNLKLTSSDQLNRQIYSSYYNVTSKTDNTDGTVIYQDVSACVFDNNKTSGSHSFAANNSSDVKRTCLNINYDNTSFYNTTIITPNYTTANVTSFRLTDVSGVELRNRLFYQNTCDSNNGFNGLVENGDMFMGFGRGSPNTGSLVIGGHTINSTTDFGVRFDTPNSTIKFASQQMQIYSNIKIYGSANGLSFPDNSLQTNAFTSDLYTKLNGIGMTYGLLLIESPLISGTFYNCGGISGGIYGGISLNPGTYILTINAALLVVATTTVGQILIGPSTNPTELVIETGLNLNIDNKNGATFNPNTQFILPTTAIVSPSITTTYYCLVQASFGTALALKFISINSRFYAVKIA
jgi:hypothetical protein